MYSTIQSRGETSGASHDDSSPAFVASTRRSAADEDDVQQRGRPAESADTRGSWDSAGTHDSDVSLSPSDSPESRQASSAAHDVDAETVAGRIDVSLPSGVRPLVVSSAAAAAEGGQEHDCNVIARSGSSRVVVSNR